MRIRLLVTPLAKGAFFSEYREVARAELAAHFSGRDFRSDSVAGLDFLEVEAEEEELPRLARLSFVQGLFEVRADSLRPLAVPTDFALPDEMVWGVKYQGKTNELATQLAINLALRFLETSSRPDQRKLLDPMAGRGTTLLWALRYGMDAKGIEREASALVGLHQHFKKQAKLHRISHKHAEGYVGRRNKQQHGKFSRYEVGGKELQLTVGNSAEAPALLARQRFDTLVTDLPYGIQHGAGRGPRALEAAVEGCVPAWVESVARGGTIVLLFNGYQTRRQSLVSMFTGAGCRLEAFSAPHRMSESILRDLVVFSRP